MTSSPPGRKVKVREIPVKSPAIEEEVFESGRKKDEVKWERKKEKEVLISVK